MRNHPAISRRKGDYNKNNRSTNTFDGDAEPRGGRLKAIIRRLPSTLTREDKLKQALGQEWMAKIDWIRFFPGSEGKDFMGNGRAYVRLKVSRDMSALKQYVESSDHEIFKKSSVSFAPCQRVRSDVGKVNPLEGTLQDFEDFTIFCAHLKEGTSYGQHVEIIDKKESGELGSTALMAFLEKQHKGKGIKKPARKSTQKSNQKPKVQADQQQKSDRGNQKDELNRIDGDKKSIKAPRVKKKGPNSKKKIAPPPGAMVPPDRPEPAMGNRPSEGASIDNQVNSNKIKRDKKKNPPKPSIKDPEATARGGKSSRGRGRGKGRGRGTGSQQIAILTRAAADVTS